MTPITYKEVPIMKRYKVGDLVCWYKEGEQPEGAILLDKSTKEAKEENASIEIKVSIPKNKSKGVKAK